MQDNCLLFCIGKYMDSWPAANQTAVK